MSDDSLPRAITVEQQTVTAMVRLYCAEHHPNDNGVCRDCGALLQYAHARLAACPYGAGKPTCKACPIHCYKPEPREAMKTVMRFSGPRMLWRHPWLALVHLWKERFNRTPTRKAAQRARAAGVGERVR